MLSEIVSNTEFSRNDYTSFILLVSMKHFAQICNADREFNSFLIK